MSKFSDRLGREWVLDVTVADIKRVRKALGVDLFDAFADNYDGYEKLMADPVLLVDVLFALCSEQAKSRGVDDLDFGRGIAGDALHAAGEAFAEALTDFFPDARARQIVRATLSKAHELREARTGMMLQAVESVNVGQLVEKSSGESTSTPGSSESTPTPSPLPS